MRILTSHKFRNSQVLAVFLRFVVDETLAGRMNEIKEYTIGIKALGRSADFNPQADAVVRIHAGRLRRLLNEYYATEGAADLVLIEIPKGSYIPVFKCRSSEEHRKTLPVAAHGQKATLAVLPFHNHSSDDSRNYFVEGMGEQLSIDLARFQHLAVISYYSAFRFVVENESIKEAISVFNVDYILNASIRFSDGMIQVNVQLISTETDTSLWVNSYQRHFNEDNLYTIQDEIIEQVVNKIADNDGIITKNIIQTTASRKNLYGVYEAVYLYYSFRGKYDADNFHQALSALEHAAAIDPENALIWALQSKLFLNNYIFSGGQSFSDLQKGKEYAERAMWLDQNSQYANKAIAWTYLLTGRKADCIEAVERCLDLNSKAPSITGSMGFLLVCVGKYTTGFHLLLKTMYLNPLMSWYCHLGFALYYYNNEKYEEAFEWIQNDAASTMPLVELVRIAILNKVKLANKDMNFKELKDAKPHVISNATAVIDQFIYDDRLKEKLLAGIAGA
jgi:adenylate cyclase